MRNSHPHPPGSPPGSAPEPLVDLWYQPLLTESAPIQTQSSASLGYFWLGVVALLVLAAIWLWPRRHGLLLYLRLQWLQMGLSRLGWQPGCVALSERLDQVRRAQRWSRMAGGLPSWFVEAQQQLDAWRFNPRAQAGTAELATLLRRLTTQLRQQRFILNAPTEEV